MAIATALDRIYELEASLSIVAPAAMHIRRVYRTAPSQSETLTDLPCFLNEVSFGTINSDRMLFERLYDWSDQITLVVAQAAVQDDWAMDVTIAFWDVFFELMGQNMGLAHEQTHEASAALLRGAQPTFGIIQHGGRAYIGFSCFLDVSVREHYLWRRGNE